jgi:hypothetical protein
MERLQVNGSDSGESQMDLDIKIFRMNRLGIPQDRIAERLGLARTSFQYHLPKMAALPNSANVDLRVTFRLSRGFTVAQVAQRYVWPDPMVWSLALEGKMVSYPYYPGPHVVPAVQCWSGVCNAEKKYPWRCQPVCDNPESGRIEDMSPHSIHNDLKYTYLLPRIYENKDLKV